MEFQQRDIDKFKRGTYENPRFWSRFKERPDLRGATVLEIGSGWGSLAADMALTGASKVVGLDLKSELVDFSSAYLRQYHPQLTSIVEFKNRDLKYYDSEISFDYIISKDTFEHVIELDSMLSEMKRRLKPGGRIYAGFGPLYTSPYGDHDRRKTALEHWGIWGRCLARIPWGHLLMESLIIDMNNRYRGKNVKSMCDLGLNKWSFAEYQRAFHSSGLSIIELQANQSTGIWSSICALVRWIPFLEDFFTYNCYVILERPREATVPRRSTAGQHIF